MNHYIETVIDNNISTLNVLNENEWNCDEAYSKYSLDEEFVGGNSNPNYIFLIQEDKLIEFTYNRPLSFTQEMRDAISNGFSYSKNDLKE